MISEQKDIEVISADDENENEDSSNQSGNEEKNQPQNTFIHKSPNIPNSKIIFQNMQMNNPSLNKNPYYFNTNVKIEKKKINNNKKKKNNFLSASYTPQYTSQNMNIPTGFPNPSFQPKPQQQQMLQTPFQRAMLSPVFMYDNNQNGRNNVQMPVNNPQQQNPFITSPYCYTPNVNNYGFTNNNTMTILSPLTPSQHFVNLSPFTNMYPNQYFSPLLAKQNISQTNNQSQSTTNQQGYQNHHQHNNSSFFSFKPSQISEESEDNIFDTMLNKKIKNKKGKKSTNENLPNPTEKNVNSLFINNKPQKQSELNTKKSNNISKSPNLSSKVNSSPKDEEKNKINIDNILYLKDKRTTLMIKNIPNKYTITTFLDEINVEFKNKYDIFYLPIDYGNKCNLGFAFINFVDPFHIINFYDMYRGKKWKRFNSEKICELVYAKIQGKKELISHFEKGKVLSFDSEEKRPLILPTPNPLPQVKLPIKLLEQFIKIFPFSNYTVDNDNSESSEYFYIQSLYSF